MDKYKIRTSTIGGLYQAAKGRPATGQGAIDFNKKILTDSRAIIAAHPDVPETAVYAELLWRRIMLPAAERLYQIEPTAENRSELVDILTRVIKNPRREGHQLAEEKLRAEGLFLSLTVFDEQGRPRPNAEQAIRELLARYSDEAEDGGFAGAACVVAGRLANQAKLNTLADDLLAKVEERFLATPGALQALIDCGRPPLIQTELSLLDGGTLILPRDTLGKVVVIDFWATWCAPCIAALPHLEKLHETYKEQGVMIVGLSCDKPSSSETPKENRAKVVTFLESRELPWPQAYHGQWPELARKYGVAKLPTVMVLGKDGRVLSANARTNLEGTIDKALQSPQGK